jgi:hypothetical protein
MLGVTLRTASLQPPVRRVGLCVGSLRSVLRTAPASRHYYPSRKLLQDYYT